MEVGLIALLLIIGVPIAIWIFAIKKIIDYAAKKFAEEFEKRMKYR